MVAVPASFAVTTPLATVAAASLLDDQLTFLLLALSGDTVAVIVPVSPTISAIVSGLTLIALTATVELPPPPPPPLVLGLFTVGSVTPVATV